MAASAGDPVAIGSWTCDVLAHARPGPLRRPRRPATWATSSSSGSAVRRRPARARDRGRGARVLRALRGVDRRWPARTPSACRAARGRRGGAEPARQRQARGGDRRSAPTCRSSHLVNGLRRRPSEVGDALTALGRVQPLARAWGRAGQQREALAREQLGTRVVGRVATRHALERRRRSERSPTASALADRPGERTAALRPSSTALRQRLDLVRSRSCRRRVPTSSPSSDSSTYAAARVDVADLQRRSAP